MKRQKDKTIPFKDFWEAYALKRDRKRAENAWARLSANDRQAAYDGISEYRRQCRNSGVSMMYAQGYLNNRRWEDEPSTQDQPVPVVEKEPEMATW